MPPNLKGNHRVPFFLLTDLTIVKKLAMRRGRKRTYRSAAASNLIEFPRHRSAHAHARCEKAAAASDSSPHTASWSRSPETVSQDFRATGVPQHWLHFVSRKALLLAPQVNYIEDTRQRTRTKDV